MLTLTRRAICAKLPTNVAIAAALGSAVLRPHSARAASFRKIYSFGGNGGAEFSSEYPSSIGIRTGQYIDALILNGMQHGGSGGSNPSTFQLSPEDYWTEFVLRSGTLVDYISLRSKNGAVLSGGGPSGGQTSLSGLRILGVGGRSGSLLNAISFTVIENYQQSKTVDRDGLAVLDFTPGGKVITTYEDKSLQTTQAFERTTQSFMELTVNTSAEGEYYAKFSASTGLKTSETTTQTIKTSSEEALKTGKKVEDTIPADQAAFLIAAITVMKDSDGNPWMYPSAGANWVKLRRLTYLYVLRMVLCLVVGVQVAARHL